MTLTSHGFSCLNQMTFCTLSSMLLLLPIGASTTELNCSSFKDGVVSDISMKFEAVASSVISFTGGRLSPANFRVASVAGSGFTSFLLLHPSSGLPACTCQASNTSWSLNCTAFQPPQPPWPAFTSCRWHLTANGLLFEVDSANSSQVCLNSATMSAVPAFFVQNWTGKVTPGQTNVVFNKYQYTLTENFNSKQYIGFAADLVINELWPVRSILISSLSNQSVLRYRPYLGWSECCLNECVSIYKANSMYATIQQDCYRVPPPSVMTSGISGNNCAWAFAIDCSPILVQRDNRSQPCLDDPVSTVQAATSTPARSEATTPNPKPPTVGSTDGTLTTCSPGRPEGSLAKSSQPVASAGFAGRLMKLLLLSCLAVAVLKLV